MTSQVNAADHDSNPTQNDNATNDIPSEMTSLDASEPKGMQDEDEEDDDEELKTDTIKNYESITLLIKMIPKYYQVEHVKEYAKNKETLKKLKYAPAETSMINSTDFTDLKFIKNDVFELKQKLKNRIIELKNSRNIKVSKKKISAKSKVSKNPQSPSNSTNTSISKNSKVNRTPKKVGQSTIPVADKVSVRPSINDSSFNVNFNESSAKAAKSIDKISQLKRLESRPKADDQDWDDASKRLTGDFVNAQKLKKAIKRNEKEKSRSTKEWAKRADDLSAVIENQQKKRKQNLDARKDKVKSKKK